MRLFDKEVSVRIGTGKDAETQNVRDDKRRFPSAVHAIVGELVRRKALGIEGTKTGFVTKERPACHGHAAGEKSLDR